MTTKADTSVKWFHSGMADAPVLNGLAGSMIELLDACLINGFSTRNPDSVVVAGGVATVSISAGNPYDKHAVIAISGASEAALNAEWRIDTSAASSFTFLCPGVADGTVTGAVLKRAGAGWGKPFADTNVAVYQSLDPSSTQLYLQVIDTHGRAANIVGYEQMTDAVTGAGRLPTTSQSSSGLSWAKSSTADAVARTWAIFSDEKIFYLYLATYGIYPGVGGFGDIESFVDMDRYNCVVAGANSHPNLGYPSSSMRFCAAGSSGAYMARHSDQVTVSGTPAARSAVGSSAFGTVGYGGPAGGQNVLRGSVCVNDTNGSSGSPLRGILPGVIEPLHHAFSGVRNVASFDGSGAFSGRQIVGLEYAGDNIYGSIAFDVTGPWR